MLKEKDVKYGNCKAEGFYLRLLGFPSTRIQGVNR